MISPIERRDPDLLALQRAAYAAEAALIGFPGLPPLRETLADLRTSPESFLGCCENGKRLGAIAWEMTEGLWKITRLVVHPDATRRGIATNLLAALEAEARKHGVRALAVATASANHPALHLYQKLGFAIAAESAAPEGLPLVHLRKSLV